MPKSADQPIKVFHVEDYKIMRDGIRQLLSQDRDIYIVGEAKDGQELFAFLDKIEVDVLVLDIYLDGMENFKTLNGFQICQLVSEKFPQIRILAHSVYDDADRVAAILKVGADGFVSKKSGYEELIAGIKAVYAGKKFFCSATSGKLKNLNKFLSGIEPTLRSKDEMFSRREREILELLSKGKSSKQIGATLFITERTVESHRKNMIKKGNVSNTVELIAFASALGLIKI